MDQNDTIEICYPPRSRGCCSAQEIGPVYLLYFAGTNPSFRLPELQSALTYLNSDYALIPTPLEIQSLNQSRNLDSNLQQLNLSSQSSQLTTSNWIPSTTSPFFLIHLPNDELALQLSKRLITVRSIHQLWSSDLNLQNLHLKNKSKQSKELWQIYQSDQLTWKGNVIKHNRSNESFEKLRETIEDFSYMDFKGRIDLKNPKFIWSIIFDFPKPIGGNPLKLHPNQKRNKTKEEEKIEEEGSYDEPKQVFLGRMISKEEELGRNLINRLDLKKRTYIGNTSMEAEMSLIMASMALAGPSTFMYDPFAGTGSMLYACAAFGSMVCGSDIDIRMMRGKGQHEKTGVMRSASQYGLQGKIMDCLGCDMTQHPWRTGGIFDAIVTDPPYGVRAGAKRLGRKDPSKLKSEPWLLPDGTPSHTLPDYVPPSQPYHLLDLVSDLLEFSAFLLKPGGRLVFWIPTMTEVETFGIGVGNETGIEEKPVELPESKDFKLIAHSLQEFGKWGRRLVTMERLPPTSPSSPSTDGQTSTSESVEKPWHITPSQHKRGAEKEKIQYGQDPREFRNQYYMPKDKVSEKKQAGSVGS